MKILYLRLENVIGLKVGSDHDFIEIDFRRSNNKIISIQARNGVGKALPNSTLIPSPTGVVRMGNIKVGDIIFGADGNPTTVIGVYPQGIRDVWEIEFSYGKKAKCCDEHLWTYEYTRHGKRIVMTSPLKDIVNRYRNLDNTIRNLKVLNNKSVQYESRDVPIHPYVLGAFIGDGCLSETDLTISSSTDEIPNNISKLCGIQAEKTSSENYSYIFRDMNGKRIQTKIFFKDLPEIIGLLGYQKYIPNEYIFNSEEVRWEVIKGLMDTDGSAIEDRFRPEKIDINITSTSKQLLLDVQYIFRSLGINGIMNKEDKRVEKYKHGFCSAVRLVGNIEQHVDKICSLSRKKQRLIKAINSDEYRRKSFNVTDYNYNYIRKIDKLDYQEEMTCIMVSNEDGLFLTEDFIVTHNTTLLSSLTPFAGVTSVDERSSLSYIIPNKNGYKQIEYQHGDDVYVIKHYYKATKDTHSVKSYFQCNGEELNENGNVTSFLALVELHLGITTEMIRLVRLGTNVNSFLTLSSAERKTYIGRLIAEVELYLKIYKKINEDIRVVKILSSSNNTNLYNCHISDLVVEEERLSKLNKQIREREKERDQLVAKISKIQALEKENNIEDLRRKKQEAEVSLIDFKRVEELIHSFSLQNTGIDQLVKKRTNLTDAKINTQSKINSYKISIDNTLSNIERIETSVKKITSDNDVQSLLSAITDLKTTINSVNKAVSSFIAPGCTSDEVYQLITKLSSFNQVSQMIYTLGNTPSDIYLKLKRSNKSVDKFLKEQSKKNMSRLSDDDIKRLFSQVFQDEGIISPNCDTQFTDCPYYRFSDMIFDIKDKMEEDKYDDETLRYIQVISNNIDNMLNEIDKLRSIDMPDALKDILREKMILDRLDNKLPFFELSSLQEYISMLREFEIYRTNIDKLKQYEYQLSIYKNSGIDSQLEEMKRLKENISFYNNNITTLGEELTDLNGKLEGIDEHIGLVTKYNDGKKYRKIVEATLESTNKVLTPLESSSDEKIELTYQMNTITNMINGLREESKCLDTKLTEYNRLVQEKEFLDKKNKDLSMILESVSTKKGIPVLYMKSYLGKIQKLANNLLQLIYDDELQLAKFKVTQETFEVPYVKNGRKIADVKYASQSEVALVTMALSFALANQASGNYNILLLDEIDAGLDTQNRAAFLKMLYSQMEELKAEQVFIISHNIASMNSIPMDVIKLSDIDYDSKLSNIIYE